MRLRDIEDLSVETIKKILGDKFDIGLDETAYYLIIAKFKETIISEFAGSYQDRLKALYIYIIRETIKKAKKILGNEEDGDLGIINAEKLLKEQNKCSADKQNGFIWVINTAITYIADYNTKIFEI